MNEKCAIEYLFKESEEYEPLSLDEESYYISRMRLYNDTEARSLLILSNLGIVLKIASAYPRSSLMDYEDYVSEGIIGLIIAVDKYDLLRNVKIVTYAVNWIKQTIRRAMWRMADFHFSVQAWQKMYKNELYQEKKGLHDLSKVASLSFFDDDGDEKGNIDIPDNSFEETINRQFLRESIEDCMDRTLTETEQTVIKFRFNWDGLGEYTLDEIGRMMGICRERVRQIEVKAIDKLKEAILKYHVRRIKAKWQI